MLANLKSSLGEINQESRDASLKIDQAEKERRWIEERLTSLDRDYGEWYNTFRHSEAVYRTGKIDSTLVRMNPTLSLALLNRIEQADLLLVAACKYSQYRRWIEYEIYTARTLGLPVIGVLSPGDHEFDVDFVRLDDIVQREPRIVLATLSRWVL